jgi:transcriptional regulator with XRE-family HTH domain
MNTNRLYELRTKNAYSKEYIANKLDISISKYERIENAPQKMKADIIELLSDFYKVSSDYILGLTDNPKKKK